MSVHIRYFAAAKAILGVSEEQRAAAGQTIGELMTELATSAPDASAAVTVLDRCSFLVNTRATTDRSVLLRDGDQLDVLPPFAGG